jgi:hypothetical protein
VDECGQGGGVYIDGLRGKGGRVLNRIGAISAVITLGTASCSVWFAGRDDRWGRGVSDRRRGKTIPFLGR